MTNVIMSNANSAAQTITKLQHPAQEQIAQDKTVPSSEITKQEAIQKTMQKIDTVTISAEAMKMFSGGQNGGDPK